MASRGQIISSVSVIDAGSVNYNASQAITITGRVVKDATTLALTGSTWTLIPTGSFALGTQYLSFGNVTSGSVILVALNGTASTNVFDSLVYQDATNLHPPTGSTFWAKPLVQIPFTGSYATASLQVVSIEN